MGEIVLDCATQQVWHAGELVEVPQWEFDRLRVLLELAGQASWQDAYNFDEDDGLTVIVLISVQSRWAGLGSNCNTLG